MTLASVTRADARSKPFLGTFGPHLLVFWFDGRVQGQWPAKEPIPSLLLGTAVRQAAL